MKIDKKAETLWDKSNISFIDYQSYIDRKPDRFQLTLIDLLYISNFKGGNATIKEKEEKVNVKLLEYSKQFQSIEKTFKDPNLASLTSDQLDALKIMVKACFSLADKNSDFKIDGFSASYLSALMNAYFPNLIPILDRRVLINSLIVKPGDINNQGQIINIEKHFSELLDHFFKRCKEEKKSIRDIDKELFIIEIKK
jgi:hypothetical protein